MRTPIIAVTNRKGGVGKSTLSTHLAAGLATLGWRVGLVDTDSQGHAGLMLGQPEEDGLFHVMIEKQPLAEVVRLVDTARYSAPDHAATGALYLLPSSVRTYQIPHMLNQDETFLFLEKMEEFIAAYSLNVLFIDTNPTMNMFDGAIYLAADRYIYVTECEMLAFDGVISAMEQMQRFNVQRKRYLGREARALGIVPNKHRASTRLHRYNIAQLGQRYGELVWPSIRLSTLWPEAANALELVYTYAPTGNEAQEAWSMCEQTTKALNQCPVEN